MKLGLGTERKTHTLLHANLLLKEISFLQVDRHSDKDSGPKIMFITNIFFILKKKNISPFGSCFKTCISAKMKHRDLFLNYFFKMSRLGFQTINFQINSRISRCNYLIEGLKLKSLLFLYYQNECFDTIICVALGREHQYIMNCKGLFNI